MFGRLGDRHDASMLLAVLCIGILGGVIVGVRHALDRVRSLYG